VISLRNFPARKCFGVIMGSLAGVFAVAFLTWALFRWEAVPDGVLGLIGTLTGGFGGYVWSSSYEAARNVGGGDDAQERHADS
jgi:hypothetical protein